MKSFKILAAGAAALVTLTTVQAADYVVHFTGATAFRTPAVNGIISALGGSANTQRAYQGTSGGAAAATRCIIKGNFGTDTITVKCYWTGSAGGVKAIVEDVPLTGNWMSTSNLGAVGTETPVASPSFALDSGWANGPETQLADCAFSDAAQATTGYTGGNALSEFRLGVIPFEWVLCNTTPAPANGAPAAQISGFTNISTVQAQAVLAGGAPMSMFTGNTADTGTVVYALGRDFDSGTRISCLAESGVGVFGSVQHIQPTITGTAGAAGSTVTEIKLWPAATLLDLSFPIGNSGFASGGTLADNLATPGAQAAITSGGGIPVAQQVIGVGLPSVLIGYLGQSDASRACKRNAITGNNARRLAFNGYNFGDPVNINATTGASTTYNNNAIYEGLYQAWEYEWFSYRQTGFTGVPQTFADGLVASLKLVAPSGALLLSNMHVSKSVEGGTIVYGNPF